MNLEELAEKHAKNLWEGSSLEKNREYAEFSFKKGYEACRNEITFSEQAEDNKIYCPKCNSIDLTFPVRIRTGVFTCNDCAHVF